MNNNNQLDHNYKCIIKKINDYQIKYNQINHKIKLLAVSKTKPIANIIELINAGQIDFAENYINEAINKINQLKLLNINYINWHFIGQIQSNKTKIIAENFHWVHSIDKFKLAKRLSDQRPDCLEKLNILIQVNLQNDINKAGIPKEEVYNLAQEINNIENSKLKLRGLMCILKLEENTSFEIEYNTFKILHNIYETLNTQYNCNLDTLSMGMSNDYKAAIAAGSTMVRIGSKLFGERINNPISNL